MQGAAARDSLAPLLAAAIFTVLGDGVGWLERMMSVDSAWVCRTVRKFKNASKLILSRSDRRLGLCPPMGRNKGYRGEVESLIADFLENALGVAGLLNDTA